jgi:hypothetical protein
MIDCTCNCAPLQPCPACGYCPCCGRRGHQFSPFPVPYYEQPWYPPYPQPIWVGGGYTGGYVPTSTTGGWPPPGITVTC